MPPTNHKKPTSKKSYVLALTLATTSLMTGLTVTSTTTHAASLGDLFSSSANKSKFLPVDKAFQVNTSTKATAKGTQLTIKFDITPEHYVYKDKLTDLS